MPEYRHEEMLVEGPLQVTSPATFDDVVFLNGDTVVGATGRITFADGGKLTAPVIVPAMSMPGDIPTGTFVFWIDEDNDKLIVKAKYGDQTIALGEVTLVPQV